MATKAMRVSVGDRFRRANGVTGFVRKVCRVHAKWAHPRDHVEMEWADRPGVKSPMTFRGLARLTPLGPERKRKPVAR